MQSRLSPEGCVQCQENGKSHEACQAPKSILREVDFGPNCYNHIQAVLLYIKLGIFECLSGGSLQGPFHFSKPKNLLGF